MGHRIAGCPYLRHPRKTRRAISPRRNPVTAAKAAIYDKPEKIAMPLSIFLSKLRWIPSFAGMKRRGHRTKHCQPWLEAEDDILLARTTRARANARRRLSMGNRFDELGVTSG
ncbi:MAG TPA: hypothetical protein PKE16_19685 [Hyphomicrobium sp.]|nr:hypothetical protein [Hyphomicrobium sp.]